jgi:predicted RNase H-like nuclease
MVPSVVLWETVNLLGIDVGYSQKNKTTGIAVCENGDLTLLCCVGSSAQDRSEALPPKVAFDAIALDGPIVRTEPDDPPMRRACELMLIGGMFAGRCKPGLSHFGDGLKLRRAATIIATEMTQGAKPYPTARYAVERVPDQAVIEAFPNAFLGVLLDDDAFAALGRLPRGKKFDRFYEYAVKAGIFESLLDDISWPAPRLRERLRQEADDTSRASHDKRAALVCVLTAAFALTGRATFVGDQAGGWICLPPQNLWAPWATNALHARMQVLITKGASERPPTETSLQDASAFISA